MGKASRHHHLNGKPTAPKEIRVQLTPREFAEFRGANAIATLDVQAIQQAAAQQIAVIQQQRQAVFLKLVRKYQRVGMRPDQNYRFDETSHSLVLIPESKIPG